MKNPLDLLRSIDSTQIFRLLALILILVMIFRPHGLISFTELNVKELMRPRNKERAGGVE